MSNIKQYRGMKICEICENEEIEYLPYSIEYEIYMSKTCFFCKGEVYICSLCTKYYYRRGKDGYIPNKYKDISWNLSKDPPQCRKCISMDMRNKYIFCIMCSVHIKEEDFIECDKCLLSSCKDCNKNNICAGCEGDIRI